VVALAADHCRNFSRQRRIFQGSLAPCCSVMVLFCVILERERERERREADNKQGSCLFFVCACVCFLLSFEYYTLLYSAVVSAKVGPRNLLDCAVQEKMKIEKLPSSLFDSIFVRVD
jgi:hypothetical protein